MILRLGKIILMLALNDQPYQSSETYDPIFLIPSATSQRKGMSLEIGDFNSAPVKYYQNLLFLNLHKMKVE